MRLDSGMSADPRATAAIVLAGGRGSRLGGRDKSAIAIGGRTTLDAVLAATAPLAVRVVVGPATLAVPHDGVVVVQEDPPRSGPAAGIAAGLAAIETDCEYVLVLAVDLRHPAAVVSLLVSASETGEDVLLPVDETGREQPLAARYRTAALRLAVAGAGPLAGAPVRRLTDALVARRLDVGSGVTDDIDTEDDLRLALTASTVEPVAGDPVPASRAGAAGMTDQDALLAAWWDRLTAALGLEAVPADIDAILGLAGAAAHGVVRPAAPVTTFLAGYAAGRAGGQARAVSEAIATAAALAREQSGPEA